MNYRKEGGRGHSNRFQGEGCRIVIRGKFKPYKETILRGLNENGWVLLLY